MKKPLKNLTRRLTKSSWFQSVLCWLIASYIRFVYYTSSIVFDMPETTKPYMEGTLPAIYAFWHGRLLLMPMICPPKRKMHVLISTHRDGEIIARAMHNFHFGTVRGSSTRGGGDAAMKAVRTLLAGDNVSITPDGPKGPAMVVQQGIIGIAELSKLPVIGVTFASTRHKRARSWDRFMVALPFGKVFYKWTPPLMNPTKEELEKAMIDITKDVDEDAGA